MTAGGTADKSVNNAAIYVALKDLDKRNVSQQQLMQRTRELLKQLPADIHTSVDLVSTVGGNQSNADIQYFIQGPDLDKLAQTMPLTSEKTHSRIIRSSSGSDGQRSLGIYLSHLLNFPLRIVPS